MTTKRLYRVSEPEGQNPDRLIMAGSQAQAIRHVVGTRFEAVVATPTEVARLVGEYNIKVEIAGDDNAE